MADSRLIIENNLFENIQQSNHQLDNFFELRKSVCGPEDKDTKLARNVELLKIMRSQLSALTETILQKQKRGRPSLLMKVSIDSGGGLLKTFFMPF